MIESSLRKKLIVVGGPNGSGKTTLAKEIITHQNITYISADDIAYELAPDNPKSVRVQAGKEFFKRLETSISNEESILIESTLSGKSLFSLLERYQRENDYSITIVFIYLANVNVCVERVSVRVEKGGHKVPVKDIERRFPRSLYNFWNLYRKLSNRWYLFYNSDDSFEEVAKRVSQEQIVRNEELFGNFRKMARNYE